MSDIVQPPEGTPTQVAHPVKATARTIAAYIVAGLLAVITFGPPIIEAFLVDESLPDGLRSGLLALAGAIALVAGIVTRLMAIPGADKVLRYLGLDTGVAREREGDVRGDEARRWGDLDPY